MTFSLSLISSIALYVGLAAQYGLHLFSANFYGAEGYGYIASIINFILIISLLSQFGFSHSLPRIIGKNRSRGGNEEIFGVIIFSSFLTLSISTLISFLIFIISIFYPDLIDWSFIEKNSIFIFGLLPFMSLLLLFQNINRSFRRPLLAIVPQGVVLPLLIIMIVWWKGDKNIESFVVAYTLITFALAVLLGISVVLVLNGFKIGFSRVRFKVREWLSVSITMLITNVSTQSLQRLDVLILLIFLDPMEVGIYAIASRLANAMILGANAISNIQSSQFSHLFINQKHREIQVLIADISKLSLIMGMLMLMFFAVFGELFFDFLGNDFAGSYELLMILMIGGLVYSMFSPNITFMQMTKYEKELNRITLFILILSTSAYFILVPTFGVYAAAFITTFSNASLSLFAAKFVKNKGDLYKSA